MSKPKYEREFEQLEAIRRAQRRGEWPVRADPRYALGMAYLDKLDAARRRSAEAEADRAKELGRERRKREELTVALRSSWWNQ